MEFDLNTHKINWEVGEKEQTIQNVKNLIEIGMFSVPLNRQIGVSKEYLDKEEDVARILILSEIERNLEIYEPRVKLNSFDLVINGCGDYKLNLELIEAN